MRGIADAPPATVLTVAGTRRPLTASEAQAVRKAAAAGWLTRRHTPQSGAWRSALGALRVSDPELGQTFKSLLADVDAAAGDDERLGLPMLLGAARWLFDRLDHAQAAEAHRALTRSLTDTGAATPEEARRAVPVGAGFSFDGVWLSL